MQFYSKFSELVKILPLFRDTAVKVQFDFGQNRELGHFCLKRRSNEISNFIGRRQKSEIKFGQTLDAGNRIRTDKVLTEKLL